MMFKAMMFVALVTVIPVLLSLFASVIDSSFFKVAGTIAGAVNLIFWTWFVIYVLVSGVPTCL